MRMLAGSRNRKEQPEKTAIIIVFEEDVYNSMFEVLFADIMRLPDVYSVVEKNYPTGKLFSILPSRKLRKLTFGLSNLPYLSYYNLPRKVRELSRSYNRIHILFHNASLRKTQYPLFILDYLKKHYSVTLNLLYLDVRAHANVCNYANMLCDSKIFDRVMTFDPDDAKRYNMELCFTPYSKVPVDITKESAQLYFCGSNSNRILWLYLIWYNARNRDIAVIFDLVGCQPFKHFFEDDPGVHFCEGFLDYSASLSRMQGASCILDITQSGQTGFTLRPYEAVVYNKKLLTNNKRIFEFKYYDERYMKYFERIDDIDWNWLSESVMVDYGYTGEFSPSILMQRLNET